MEKKQKGDILRKVVPGFRNAIGFEYRITLVYLLIAFLWIIFSDLAVENLIKNDDLHPKLQTYKGIFYVLVTGLVLFALVRRQMRRISEQRLNFEGMFNTIHDAVVIANSNREIVLANKGLELMFGYNAGEITGKSTEILYAKKEEYSKAGDLIFSDHSQKDIATYICYYQGKDGKAFPGETHGTKLFDNDGNWIGSVAIIHDVTERLNAMKRTELALELAEKNERRIRSTLDSMLEGCQIIGLDWKYLYINSAAAGYSGSSREELHGRPFDEVWKNISPPGLFSAISQCMVDGISVRGEFEFTLPDHSHRWFDIRIQRIPEGIFILWIDTTRRRQAEEKMRENDLKFKRIYETGPFGMVMVGQDFKFKHANETFSRMVGYQEAELQQMTVMDVTHPDDIAMDTSNLKKLFEGSQSVYKIEKRYLHKGGNIVHGSLTANVIRDSSGEFLYFLAIIEPLPDKEVS